MHATACAHKVLRMTDTPITKMLTSAEACEQLNIDRSTLSRWVKSGRIETAHKFPGKRGGFLFTVDQVRAAAAVKS